ncbi:MAG: hypothetical protein V1807_03010 [Patescibacteria group bacterium]
MKVLITGGYGDDETTEAEQKKFLNDFKNLLRQHGLPVDSIVSERTTGGPIILTISDDVDPDEIPRAFLSLATALAQQVSGKISQNADVSFVLRLPGCSEPITVTGCGGIQDGHH